jgi:hypothetical protein
MSYGKILRLSFGLAITACFAGLLASCGSSGQEPKLGSGDKAKIERVLVSPAPSAEAAAYRQKYANNLAECMKKAGFDYRYWVPPDATSDSLGMSSEEFAGKYGFGVSTLIDWHPPGIPLVNPNNAVVRKLTPRGRASYNTALETCRATALKILGLPPAGTMKNVVPMSESAADVVSGIALAAEKDARVATAKKTYLGCMAQKGYQLTSPDEVTASFVKRSEPYVKAFWERVGQVVESGQNPDALKMADVLTPAQQGELAKLQQEEISTAVTGYPCLSALTKVVDAVHREYEQKYLMNS